MDARILDYVKPEELERLRDARRAEESAKKEVERLQVKVAEVDHALTDLARRRRGPSPAQAAAELLGEVQPKEPEPTARLVDPDALRNALQGLQQRVQQAEDESKRLQGESRREAHAASLAAAARISEDYVTSARKTARLHTLLAAAHLIAATRGGSSTWLLPDPTWNRLLIPGSDMPTLPALRKASRDFGMHGPLLAGGIEGPNSGAYAAADELSTDMVAAVGHWPIKVR